MTYFISVILLCGFAMLSACSSKPISEQAINPIFKADDPQDEQRYNHFIGHPTQDAYSICFHNTCKDIANLSLSDEQWQQITSVFSPAAISPEQERTQIKLAIALFEQFSGQQSPSYLDRAKNDLSGGAHGQLDCIDEATNTSVYLRIIDQANLLQFHQQASRITRGIFSGNPPHTTATIIDRQSGERFAVDAWFEANGQPPHIVSLEQWKQGWKPNEDK
jgi:hypothetical protein